MRRLRGEGYTDLLASRTQEIDLTSQPVFMECITRERPDFNDMVDHDLADMVDTAR